MLVRWASAPPSPEVRLACAVIASGIVEEMDNARERKRPAFVSAAVVDPLRTWCEFIGIKWQFVLDCISDCNAVDIKELRRMVKREKCCSRVR